MELPVLLQGNFGVISTMIPIPTGKWQQEALLFYREEPIFWGVIAFLLVLAISPAFVLFLPAGCPFAP